MNKIPQIVDLRLLRIVSKPPCLLIVATGAVPTSGWSDPELVPYRYLTPPPDGYWEFDFVATAPTGPAAEVITPTVATFSWSDYPSTLKGTRVHGAENKVGSALAAMPMGHEGGGDVPYPWRADWSPA